MVNLLGQTPRMAWIKVANGPEMFVLPQRSGDSLNLYLLGFDGTMTPLTAGAGMENWASVTPSGDLVFSRTDQVPSIWSVPLGGQGQTPTKEASPARMFTVSEDGARLIFGRLSGITQGQLVLQDRARDTETILASHEVRLEGAGSLWPQLSPDGRNVIYRIGTEEYLIATEGGSPKQLASSSAINLVSDWSPDGTRAIGECSPVTRGICELIPDTDTTRLLLADPSGGQLLAPSFSPDGRWVAFMRRKDGRTRVTITAVSADGTLRGPEAWIAVSQPDGEGGRPRFSPDGAALVYQLTRGSVMTIVRHRLDPATKMPAGEPVTLASVQNIPPSVFNIGLQNVLAVTKDRVFYNAADIRSNVWSTHIN
jgi:Tol biopolymer transport system component